ncbi:hypothetical protein OROMI_013752 [Orobanche minor]
MCSWSLVKIPRKATSSDTMENPFVYACKKPYPSRSNEYERVREKYHIIKDATQMAFVDE